MNGWTFYMELSTLKTTETCRSFHKWLQQMKSPNILSKKNFFRQTNIQIYLELISLRHVRGSKRKMRVGLNHTFLRTYGGMTDDTQALTTFKSKTPSFASCKSVTNLVVNNPRLFSCRLGVWSWKLWSGKPFPTRTISKPCMISVLCLKYAALLRLHCGYCFLASSHPKREVTITSRSQHGDVLKTKVQVVDMGYFMVCRVLRTPSPGIFALLLATLVIQLHEYTITEILLVVLPVFAKQTSFLKTFVQRVDEG